MRDLETARILMTMAGKDLQVLEILSSVAHAPEEAFGFHAQQAVEKTLKAWLAILGHEPPKTHSLRSLIVSLEQNGIDVEALWDLAELSPFAVQFRYESFDELGADLDYQTILTQVRELVTQVETLRTAVTKES
ncbi:MAG: HEPN domain-containing protein [Magnetococcales bacterium]|nr:HEPN domain-containing protein [Magnetococcales bacterium]